MTGEAIQPSCVVCGGPATAVSASARHGLAACSPCRAERAGAVVLELPPDTTPRNLKARFAGREFLLEAGALGLLDRWADALETAARDVRRLRDLVTAGPSDAEAVADTLATGAAGPAKLGLHNARGLRLYRLPALLARRLAEQCPMFARGPEISFSEVLELGRQKGR